MNKAGLFVSALLLSALACAPAVAETVRVKVSARVTQAVDPFGALHGKIVQGQRLTGTYVYNTNTPDESPTPDVGQYHPYANEARMRFAAAGFIFESVQPTQEIFITVDPEDVSSAGAFSMASFENKSLPTGASVISIMVRFNGSGNVTQSTALPNVAPSLTNYTTKQVRITGNAFTLIAEIESAELIVADAIEVSPAAGRFVPGQQFDAALTLPRNSDVVNVIAKANGAPLPIGFPGSCILLAPVGGQPTVICPSASSVLPLAAGAPIEWTVELSNGTVLTETVNWTLAQ